MSGLRLQTGQDKALRGAGKACVYIWNFGGVDVQSLQLRGQQLRARRAGIDSGCVWKETRCKVPAC